MASASTCCLRGRLHTEKQDRQPFAYNPTASQSNNRTPSPLRGEGRDGGENVTHRGDSFTPTLALPHQGGGNQVFNTVRTRTRQMARHPCMVVLACTAALGAFAPHAYAQTYP